MDPSFLVLQALSGLAGAASLFVVASGLTLVFGVTRIVNFAHGSFTMLGAYIAVSLVPRLLDLSASPAAFFLGVVLSALLVGLIGVAVEMLLLRRLYRLPDLFQLLATFGVVLIVEDLVLAIWGPLDLAGPRAPSLRHGVAILGQRFPAYDLVLIGIGPLVLAGLWLLMHRTRFGILIRAATQDRDMVGALGVNQARLFTLTLFLGAALAGLGGALQIPRVPANAHMDLGVITDAFVVTVIGGMGSVPGAFLAALLIGELQAFGILILPRATLVLVFALMAVVLVVKPWGLLGRPESAAAGRPPEGILSLRRLRPAEAALTALAVAALLALPLVADASAVRVATEILIFALAAFSLQVLVGVGGLVSFGHAAYFGLGAYAAGLLVTGPLKAPMELALLAAPLAAAAGAALFGLFVVRLSGIYLAMLTLAFAQILYAVGVQWGEVTGGDNGLVGVWPAPWAAGRIGGFYLVAAVTLAAILVLRRIVFAPFGYTLRAARDSATRAEAIGLDVRTHRWLAFTLAGAAAGLAGGLYAFQKGSIDPTLAAIPTSIDLLVMVLIGGIRTLMGPLLGAAFLHVLKDAVMPLTTSWRLLLGLAIIATVLLFPRGLAGAADLLSPRSRRSQAEARA
ncbi:ABC transporter permease [Methylobacterium sp. JK268]